MKLSGPRNDGDGQGYQHDEHVRLYYDQPANNFEKYYSSKFEGGQTVAVAVAYEESLNGCYDDFVDVNEGGFYCRVLFDQCPYIVCFKQDEQGFITEISNGEYELAWLQYIEGNEETND